MIKLHIDINSEISDDLLHFLIQYSDNYFLYDIIKNEDDNEELKLLANLGVYKFNFNDINYEVDYNEEGDIISCPNGPERKKNLIIKCNHFDNKTDNFNAIQKLILKIRTDSKPMLNNNIRIHIVIKSRWSKLNNIRKRSLDTVFLNNKNKIVDDLKIFMESENLYNKHGIKFKRNYLLYGPPGSGKTSLITALASKYNLDIFMLNLSAINDDNEFIKLISKLPERSLLVLEDIESLFDSINNRQSKTNITFSTILNTLDGFATKHRLITFLTTNHKDKLDSALLRPGRIDFIMEFKYATKNQLNDMYNNYFDDNNFSVIWNTIKTKKITTAAFHKFLFDNRDSKNILDNIENLLNLVEQYKSYQNLYC